MASTDNIYLDIETGPSQDPAIVEHIRCGIESELGEKVAALEESKLSIKVPKNYTKQETIDAYVSDKRAEIEGDIQDAIKAATEKFDESWRKTALDGAFGQVFTCSLGFGSDYPIGLFDEDWRAADYEVRLLQRINETVEAHTGRHRGQLLVGHNVIGFDRKFLRQRGIIRQVRMHPIFTKEVKPWDSDAVQDTMTLWTGDVRDRIKLDKLCLILGVEMKGTELDEDIDGAKVWDFIRDGKIAKVSHYCDWDVIRARSIWHRLKFLPVPPAIPSAIKPADELDDIPL